MYLGFQNKDVYDFKAAFANSFVSAAKGELKGSSVNRSVVMPFSIIEIYVIK